MNNAAGHSTSASGPVGKHTAHYLDMVAHVGANTEHGYHYHHLMVVFQISGPFDAEKFKTAAIRTFAANPALRTSFHRDGNGWRQDISADVDARAFELRRFSADAGDWKKAAQAAIMIENDTPLALNGEPLAKIIVLDFPEAKVVFGKFHHIVCDGWGILVAMNHLLGFYLAELAGANAPIPSLPAQAYVAVAAEENKRLAAPEGLRTLDWWRTYVDGHELVTRPLPVRPNGVLGVCPGFLSAAANTRIAETAARHGFHVSYLAHAAFVKALRGYLGTDDILLTYVKANRNDANANLVVNTADWVMVRHRLDFSKPLAEIARAAQRDINEAKEKYLPYWHIVEHVCPQQYLNDFGVTPYSFDFVPAFEPKVDLGGPAAFHLLHDLQVFPFRLTATDIFCRATQYRDPASGELHLSVDLIYHAGFLAAEKVQSVSDAMKAELENPAIG